MGRPRKGEDTAKAHRKPDVRRVRNLYDEMAEAGESVPDIWNEEKFKQWLKTSAERELWFFSRWILGNEWLGEGTFHRETTCPFLSTFDEAHFKLLMLPMGHMKTTIASRSMPLHMLIQPKEANIYFPGKKGCDLAICVGNENEQKSKENFAVSRTHLEDNDWIHWLWPHLLWENSKSESPRWSDTFLEVKRQKVRAEASITSVGVKTGFIGRYFDAIIADDICALQASQSAPVMEAARKWRKAARTRLSDKKKGIYIVVGTHWSSVDIYVEMQKEPAWETMKKSILEWDENTKTESSLWPEHYPLETVNEMQRTTDPIEWALWYMNKPVPAGYTALNWEDVREYTLADGGKTIVFHESRLDERIALRQERISRNLGFTIRGAYDPSQAKLRQKPPQGMDKDYYNFMRDKYPDRIKDADRQH